MDKPTVFFEISIGGEPFGVITMELFANVVPKTCENFRRFCIGENETLCYRGSIFHRVIKNFMIQGGNIEAAHDSDSIKIFPDENFIIKHNSPGLLSMANNGPNSNGSQFFITTAPASHLDGKNVVFGKVLKGMNLVRCIEALEVTQNDRPLKEVRISDCGQITKGSSIKFINDGTSDIFPNFPDDVDEFDWFLADNFQPALRMIDQIKNAGNVFYKIDDVYSALLKYRKVERYIYHLRNCIGSTEEDEEDMIRSIEIPNCQNIAAVLVRNQEWNEARKI